MAANRPDKIPPPTSFGVIAESPDWIVVDKPPFLQVHPSKPGDGRTLWHGLRDLLAFELVCGGQISIINRLDRESSGLTLIAKTRPSAASLSRQMAQRKIQKEYLALVWGWPTEESWTIDAPILRQGEKQLSPIYLKQTVHPDGAAASTRFSVLKRFEQQTTNGSKFSLIRAHPHTGRMHQIRVHLSHSGHPIVGDKIYGPDERCYLEFIDTGWTASLDSRLLLPRHALHSNILRLEETAQTWEAPLAPDLQAFMPNKP